MKYLILSDIHGSYKRLQEALETPLPYDGILLVGDLLYHWPRNPILDDYNPAKVIEILNDLDKPLIAVRGNCDAEVDQMVLQFPMMSDYSTLHLYDKHIFMTHGHLIEPKDASSTKADLFISGHTHIPGFTWHNQTLCLNPGSIALPKENHKNTYAYLHDEGIGIYDLNHQIYDSYKFKEPQ